MGLLGTYFQFKDIIVSDLSKLQIKRLKMIEFSIAIVTLLTSRLVVIRVQTGVCTWLCSLYLGSWIQQYLILLRLFIYSKTL
ncbi:hypothetical protein BDF14DRAFT_1752076 [Spinellus fusiger]|nr:hypothetical protein BDF14DRAFT_1752076 [Spinellus fusiger]